MPDACRLIRYFTFLVECTTPKACTILLRGPSKDILNEIDRNLADAMAVARNVVFNPLLAPGGGATEMAISVGLSAKVRFFLFLPFALRSCQVKVNAC